MTIGNETFLLDATEKELSFGLLPTRALNYQGRAMDFKNPSYWCTIAPYQENRENTIITIIIEEDGIAKELLAEQFISDIKIVVLMLTMNLLKY